MSIRVLTSGSDGGTNSNGRKIFRGTAAERGQGRFLWYYGSRLRIRGEKWGDRGAERASERARKRKRERSE